MRKLYKIGPLLLDPEARVLTQEGGAVALGARAVAVLVALVSRANEYVEKSAILDASWPGLVVGEANLAVQISAIRRTLARVPGGEGWIETLPRRGYRFVGPVDEVGRRPGPPIAAGRTRSNLPELLTSFVGRERELAELKQLLPTTRLLTLTGTGGIGKTRLAQQAAAEMLDAYRNGVWFVDLAPLTDPALVPNALAQVLQLKESAGQPLLSALCDYLRQRETLLILDNCEQVLDMCARLVETLLRETERVTVIATSREALHLASEQTYPLAALPMPDPKASAQSIARSDAVQLFVERARQYRPRFDLQEQRARAVAKICVRLDGIPLALELAAARVAVLPVEQIVRLLDQRFRLLASGDRELPRHQTLRAMIDWSYELLDEAEKTLFARLSAFAGGWTLAAAEAVCGSEPIGKDEVVYVLIGLIEQSLVVADQDGDRYRMLETVREYAKEKLAASGGADQVRHRHLDYFLAFAPEAHPKLHGPEQSAWMQHLDEEQDNLRSALDLSLADAGSVGGMRLCYTLAHYWWSRGYTSEGRAWCGRFLAKTGAEEPTKERAKVLNVAGVLARQQSDYAAARKLHEEGLAIQRQLSDRVGIRAALTNLGNVALEQGDYSAARAAQEECLAIARELGNQWAVAASINNLGLVALEQGNYSAARVMYEECLAIFRELGDRQHTASSLHNLGEVAFGHGDLDLARATFEESLAIKREVGNRDGIALTLNSLGDVACEQADYSATQALHMESLAIAKEMGDRRKIAKSLEGRAASTAGLGSPPRAARIWGAAERLREDIGSPLPPNERPRYERHVASARAASGNDAAFDRAWKEGRALTLEQAIELALAKSSEQQ